MSLVNEREFNQEILVTPIFNVGVSFFIFHHFDLSIMNDGIGHVIKKCPYRASQFLATCFMSNFVPNSSLVLSQVHSPIIVPLA
jgi:hypothetical protein